MCDKTNEDLKIDHNPELLSDPKERIKYAIQIAHKDYPKRRKKPDISELYQPIGQKVSLPSLRKLASFQKFESSAKEALKKLNYLF